MSAHTPGPWGWYGSPQTGFYLATRNNGRRYVMKFKRMGMDKAQPTFQLRHEMIPADELCIYEVAPGTVGKTAAKQPGSGVYRDDITGIDHPDARLIAAAPEMFELLKLYLKETPGDLPPTLSFGHKVEELIQKIEGEV